MMLEQTTIVYNMMFCSKHLCSNISPGNQKLTLRSQFNIFKPNMHMVEKNMCAKSKPLKF